MTNNTINGGNQKFDHVYIVMRYDPYIDITNDPTNDIQYAVNTLNVFIDKSEAIAEAERLNQLKKKHCANNEKISSYYVSLARIKKGLLKNSNLDS